MFMWPLLSTQSGRTTASGGGRAGGVGHPGVVSAAGRIGETNRDGAARPHGAAACAEAGPPPSRRAAPQWISSDRDSASFSFSMSKSSRFAISRITASLPADQRSIAAGSCLHRIGRDHHRAVAVGMDDVVMHRRHAVHQHVAAVIDHVHMRVARVDHAADDLEAGRQHVEVAEGARW